MVKVAKRAQSGQLEAVHEGTEDRGAPKAKEHGFALLFAACVELQELLRAAEDERDGLRGENTALRNQLNQLHARCGELTQRVRRLEDGESSAVLKELGECVCGGRRPEEPVDASRDNECVAVQRDNECVAELPGVDRRNVRLAPVPPLHTLLRGGFLVDGSSEGRTGRGEAGVLQEDDVDLDEVPQGNDIWAIMDQSVRLRIEQWVTEQGRAVKDYGPLSELARSVDGGSMRSSTRYSLSHAPSSTDHVSFTHGRAVGEDEGLLSLCDDSSSESETDVDGSSVWDPSSAATDWAREEPNAAQPATRSSSGAGKEGGEEGRERNGALLCNTWDIDAQEDEWRLANERERLQMQRRAAQRRIQGRMRSSVETGPTVFASQTLFGRIMCGLQDRAPGVLQEALTPDLRDAFTPF